MSPPSDGGLELAHRFFGKRDPQMGAHARSVTRPATIPLWVAGGTHRQAAAF